MNKVIAAVAAILPAFTVVWGQDPQYESFEDGIPPYFLATRAASLSMSPWHSKQGKNSLRWDWLKGEELVIRHGIGDVSRRGGLGNSNVASFSVWVYTEQPLAGALVFEFREGKKVTGFFRFPLEFTGWRQGRFLYLHAPGEYGKPTAKVDNIRIAAPTTAARGPVFLDWIKYNTLSLIDREVYPEKEAQWRRPVPDERRYPRPTRVTRAELESLRKLRGLDTDDEGFIIRRKVLNEGLDFPPNVPPEYLKALCDKVKALGIVRGEHGVHGGPGIECYRYCGASGERGGKSQGEVPDEHGDDWMGMQRPFAFLARKVADTYRQSDDETQRRQLLEAFLLMEDHLYDQGMQPAAGFRLSWDEKVSWSEAVFLMRDVLARAGRLQRQCDYFLWNWGSEVIFADADPPSYTDYYIRVVPRLLQACLLQPEPIEQVRWLRAFKLMLERSMLQPTSALKIDGCTYHKGGHFHDGYYGVTALAQTVQKLSGTPWRLSAEAHERLRRAALAQRLFCNRLDVPLPLCGIQPFFVTLCPYIFPDGLDCLARSGTPDGKQVFDKEVGTAYLRLAYSGTADYEPYRALNLEPEPAPNGCFVMPYAALLSHRRDNWLASVHGQSKYVAGTERQTRWNRFALFQGLGCLEILAGGDPVGARPSGRQESGWDWRHYEGTTAPQLPLNKIDKGWTSPYSPETFVGGLSHQGRQGMFAMIVNQPMPGKKTLKGRKSWFFNDNRILCLGSNISCDETDYPTQTTLCQRGLRKNQITSLPSMDQIGNLLQTCLDGEDINGLPEERALDETKPHWFLDVQQTGYYLPAGQKATVTRRHQTRRDCMNLQDREGDFLTAWLDHGKAPRSASYEYLLAVRATPEAMRKLAADPPYRLVQRDQAAHVVWDTTGRRWNCILFVPQKVTPHTVATEVLPVKNVDRPCLVMADAVWGGQFAMTVADPDLNLETPKSEGGASALGPLPLRVTLRGVWRLLEATGTVCAWRLPKASENVRVLSSSGTETVLEIFCQHGASWEIRLAQR